MKSTNKKDEESEVEKNIAKLEEEKAKKERYLQALARQQQKSQSKQNQVTAYTCISCKEVIQPSEKSTHFKGNYFHVDHFNCFHCKGPLGNKIFDHEGLPYCETHYIELFADRCQICNLPMPGTFFFLSLSFLFLLFLFLFLFLFSLFSFLFSLFFSFLFFLLSFYFFSFSLFLFFSFSLFLFFSFSLFCFFPFLLFSFEHLFLICR